VRVSYSPGYFVPLPDGHPFPMAKFPELRRILREEGLIDDSDVMEPEPADWSDLRLVHGREYLDALRRGELGRRAERRLGLPWSPRLVRRSRLAVQGTLDAAWAAIRDGRAANLAGGTHHAFPDRGEGFCVLNDVAVAIRVLRDSRWIRRSLVVDLDVHQGNATAAVFREDEAVFTYSVHGARNYPFVKEVSTRDVPLADGTGDDGYLEALVSSLPAAFRRAEPDLVFYLAGVDPVVGDRFGRLALTPEGLAARDRYVLELAERNSVPIVLLLSGGYASTAARTAELHAVVHREARRLAEGDGRRRVRASGSP